MDYRLLTTQDEWNQAASALQHHGVTPPNPLVSTMIGAFDEDKMVGVLALQPVYHANPALVTPGYDPKIIWSGMIKALNSTLAKFPASTYYSILTDPETKSVAESSGLTLAGGEVWRKGS